MTRWCLLLGVALMCSVGLAPDVRAGTPDNPAAAGNVGSLDGVKVYDLVTGQAQLLILEQEATDVVIGNPNLVTVSLVDPTTLLLTPTASGVTNLIVLDNKSKEIVLQALVRVDVRVMNPRAGAALARPTVGKDALNSAASVRVFRGLDDATYECFQSYCVSRTEKSISDTKQVKVKQVEDSADK